MKRKKKKKMADRLTQLQDAVNQVGFALYHKTLYLLCVYCSSQTTSVTALGFYKTLGTLSRVVQPQTQRKPKVDQPVCPMSSYVLSTLALSPVENSALFSTLISRTVQDIDILVDSLPSHQYTQERQTESLRQLELENQQSAEKLTRAVEEGGRLTCRGGGGGG